MKRKTSDVLTQASEVLKLEKELQRLMRLTSPLDFFKSLNEKYKHTSLHRLCCQHFQILRCRQPGELVFKAGSISDAFYVVIEGHVTEVYPSSDGNVVARHFLRKNYSKGQCFGELGVISGSRRSSTVMNGECSTTTLAMLSVKDFHGIFTPRIASELLVQPSIRMLKSLPFLSHWNHLQLQQFAAQVFVTDFKQGQEILASNTYQPKGTLVLLQGLIEINLGGGDSSFDSGRLQLSAAGDPINEEQLLDQSIKVEYASTCVSTTAKILYISNERLLHYIMSDQIAYERLLYGIEAKQDRLIFMAHQLDIHSGQTTTTTTNLNRFKLRLQPCSSINNSSSCKSSDAFDRKQGEEMRNKSAIDVSFSADFFLSNCELDKEKSRFTEKSFSFCGNYQNEEDTLDAVVVAAAGKSSESIQDEEVTQSVTPLTIQIVRDERINNNNNNNEYHQSNSYYSPLLSSRKQLQNNQPDRMRKVFVKGSQISSTQSFSWLHEHFFDSILQEKKKQDVDVGCTKDEQKQEQVQEDFLPQQGTGRFYDANSSAAGRARQHSSSQQSDCTSAQLIEENRAEKGQEVVSQVQQIQQKQLSQQASSLGYKDYKIGRSESSQNKEKKKSIINGSSSVQIAQERVLRRLFEGRKSAEKISQQPDQQQQHLQQQQQKPNSSSCNNSNNPTVDSSTSQTERLPTLPQSMHSSIELGVRSHSQSKLAEKLNEKLHMVRDKFFMEKENIGDFTSRATSARNPTAIVVKIEKKRLIDYLSHRAKSADKIRLSENSSSTAVNTQESKELPSNIGATRVNYGSNSRNAIDEVQSSGCLDAKVKPAPGFGIKVLSRRLTSPDILNNNQANGNNSNSRYQSNERASSAAVKGGSTLKLQHKQLINRGEVVQAISMNHVLTSFRKRNTSSSAQLRGGVLRHSSSIDAFVTARQNSSTITVGSHQATTFDPILPGLLGEQVQELQAPPPLLEQLQENRKSRGVNNIKRIMYSHVKQVSAGKIKTSDEDYSQFNNNAPLLKA